MSEIFRCSNPACLALHRSDPMGHCPTCKRADGSGWSCVTDTGFTCPRCGTAWGPGRMAMKCVTCHSVYCLACKDQPTAHAFACYSQGLEP
jgi:hypothetical protein